MTSLKRILKTSGAVLALGLVVATPAWAGSVENMERERAILLETLLAAEMSADERRRAVTQSQRRLVDLERIVLRDKSLVGQNTPAVRRAFANYDLTFLVHASAEKRMLIVDQWLEQLGMSTQNIMSAQVRRR